MVAWTLHGGKSWNIHGPDVPFIWGLCANQFSVPPTLAPTPSASPSILNAVISYIVIYISWKGRSAGPSCSDSSKAQPTIWSTVLNLTQRTSNTDDDDLSDISDDELLSSPSSQQRTLTHTGGRHYLWKNHCGPVDCGGNWKRETKADKMWVQKVVYTNESVRSYVSCLQCYSSFGTPWSHK